MRTLVWVIGAVVLVDLTIVAWFVVHEVLGRRRARREIDHLDRLWRTPAAVPPLRLVHSSVGGAGSSGIRTMTTGVSAIHPPLLAGRAGVQRGSLAALVGALVALVAVLTFDPGGPSPLVRAAPDGGDDGSAWTVDADGVSGGGTRQRASEPPGARSDTVTEAPPFLPVEPPPAGAAEGSGVAPAPDRVAAEPRSPDEIVIAWVPVADAAGYLIERWDAPADAAAGWTQIGTTEADATTFVDDGLEPGTTYYYRVSAVTEEGEPAPSDVVSATTLPGPPDAPVIVAATEGSSVKVEWGDVGVETGYRIERFDATETWEAIATVGQDVTLYVDGGLEKGATYGYRVVATNGSGDSPASNVVTVTVGEDEGSSTDGGSASEEPSVDEGADASVPTAEPAAYEPAVTDEATSAEDVGAGAEPVEETAIVAAPTDDVSTEGTPTEGESAEPAPTEDAADTSTSEG
jgi:Fibronectin type III domain